VPTLRNVALTAPYGHAGAYDTLAAVVRHHIDPVASRHSYNPSQLRMPSRPDLDADDLLAMNDPAVVAAIGDASELDAVVLGEEDIARLIDFLHALTDPRMLDLRGDIPVSLSSGLPLAE
jgi:cytochrome c peroxidase